MVPSTSGSLRASRPQGRHGIEGAPETAGRIVGRTGDPAVAVLLDGALVDRGQQVLASRLIDGFELDDVLLFPQQARDVEGDLVGVHRPGVVRDEDARARGVVHAAVMHRGLDQPVAADGTSIGTRAALLLAALWRATARR